MRLLIFLLALSSAFFVSSANALPDMDDLVTPSFETVPCEAASLNGSGDLTHKVCSINAKIESCKKLAATIPASSSVEYVYSAGGECVLDNGSIKIKQSGSRIYSDGTTLPTVKWRSLYYANIQGEKTPTCPPNGSPEYDIDVTAPDGSPMCAKEKDFCPEPTDNDPFVFGTGEQTTKCFNNDDGTQCKIETDESGGYYIPVSYGSAEPVQCQRPPDKEVDKTSPPEEKPAPEETDDTPQMAELDALNKINENLDAMNKNQVAASDSNDERLDRLAEETQISNEILGEIRYNTAMTDVNTMAANSLLQGILDKPTGGGGGGNGDGGDGGNEPCTGDDCVPCTGDDCPPCTGDDCKPCEGENCPPKKELFTIKSKRKNPEKGLNKLFTDEDREAVTEEITDKRDEIKDYIDKIKSDATKLFEINPSFGGGYQERLETIKGVSVDMGLGRFANFFQLLAAALMLIASLSALYILLGP